MGSVDYCVPIENQPTKAVAVASTTTTTTTINTERESLWSSIGPRSFFCLLTTLPNPDQVLGAR